MKKFKSLLALLIVGLIACACVACTPPAPEGHAFTIKVYDVDGTPCTRFADGEWVGGFQVCQVAEAGKPGTCYEATGKIDKNGIAYIDDGDDRATQLSDRNVEHVDVHIVGLPDYITFDAVDMYKGETVEIYLRYKTDADLDQPTSGDGSAVYLVDTDGEIDISEENFKPYAVANGMYRLRFASATEKIYFAFSASMAYDYAVKVQGGLDVKITQLVGDTTSGISNDGDEDKTASGVDCSYSFVTQEPTVVYFEITLLNAEQVTKDGYISFGIDY